LFFVIEKLYGAKHENDNFNDEFPL